MIDRPVIRAHLMNIAQLKETLLPPRRGGVNHNCNVLQLDTKLFTAWSAGFNILQH
jgi:hypothetical protein